MIRGQKLLPQWCRQIMGFIKTKLQIVIRFMKYIVIFGLWLTISKNNHFGLLKVSVPSFIPRSFYVSYTG